MCKLDNDDIKLFGMVYQIYNQKPHYIEFKTKSKQMYCLYREDTELFVLLHKHSPNQTYHIHRIQRNSADCLSEVLSHERYILKRRAEEEKLCGGRRIEIML